MLTNPLVGLIAAFLGGVLTHWVADALMLYWGIERSLTKFIKALAKRQGEKRLAVLRRRVPDPNDPHGLVRAEFVCSLHDLLSGKRDAAVESLLAMADILEPDEKEIAHQALKLSFLTNPNRRMDKKYLAAMEATVPD
jgi:hypothetical protein